MKTNISNQPYKWFWYPIPLMLIIGLVKINSAFDLQFHDTYIVISYYHISIFFAIYYSVVGYVYWLFKEKKLFKWMTYFHWVISIFLIFALLLIDLYPYLEENSGVVFDYDYFQKVNYIVSILFMLWIFSQLIFLLNLLISLLRKNSP